MQGFTIENEGVRSKLVYRMSDSETIDYFSFGILKENELPGIMPVILSGRNGLEELRYDISGVVSLKTFLVAKINRNQLIGIFRSIIAAINCAGVYLLDTSLFLVDTEYIYICDKRADIRMVYLPVVREDTAWNLNERIRMLFKEILFCARFVIEEQSGYITELINELNSDKEFSLTEFDNLLQRIEGNKRDEDEVNVVADYYSQRENFVDNDIVAEDSNAYINEKKKHNRSLIQYIKDIFSSSKEDCSHFNENQVIKDEYEKTDYNDEIEIHRISLVSNEHEEYDATVMLVPSVGEEGIPYLVRSSTDEKIGINKSVFRVGKEERYADYKIADNAAVSRAHAEITIRNGICYLTDEDSLNHTYVNDSMLESQVPEELHSGDVIRFADEEFVFYC